MLFVTPQSFLDLIFSAKKYVILIFSNSRTCFVIDQYKLVFLNNVELNKESCFSGILLQSEPFIIMFKLKEIFYREMYLWRTVKHILD